MTSFSAEKIKADFPILSEKIRDRDLVYLDNAASSQHPQVVIDEERRVYSTIYANVHRGVHYLSGKATSEYEGARKIIADFLGVEKAQEIIFTRGTTEALNIVASCWGRDNVQTGDEIVVTAQEHHSNFVPWQALAQEKQAKFTIIETDDYGNIDQEAVKAALARGPKIFATNAMSNVIGCSNPIREWSKLAKENGTVFVVDGAQSTPHQGAPISDYGDIDFFAFSAHKMCGPSGFGVLWSKSELLNAMRPYHYGGDMIENVGDQNSTWNILPWKFEAGTPNIAGAITTGAAIRYLEDIGFDNIREHEKEIVRYALPKLLEIPNLKLYGSQSLENRSSVFSFNVEGVHPHDIASYLDSEGIAVRTGHLCTQPLMRRLGVEGCCRASFYFYNTMEDVDSLLDSIKSALRLFRR